MSPLPAPADPSRMAINFRTLVIVTAWTVVPATAVADAPTGEQLYKSHCARCHGPAGAGTKKAPRPLLGDQSIGQLGRHIDETMPEDDPDKLDATESARVAEYIHAAFYSPAAQARLTPARVELSRLTVGQYRNSVADLLATFRPAAQPDARRGLRGEYYNARNFRPKDKIFDRLDPEVRFDFGPRPPEDHFDPHQFSIRWEGSVRPPESGGYEFVVRSSHAVRLWVNDQRVPLIDAWVKSGSGTEFTGSIDLLAGRTYPLRLEFSKAKQGVDDSKKQKARPPVPAFVSLRWKPPTGAVGVIPARHLSPAKANPGFVVTTPFPPDDRSLGWERGTAVSKEWAAATTDAALETVGYVAANLEVLAGVKPADADRPDNSGNPSQLNLDGKKEAAVPTPEREKKLRTFAAQFVERAFRRPLTPEVRHLYVDRHFAEADPDMAVKRVVVLALKSPRFLYREAGTPADQYDTAARLAFALWDSPPDEALLKAAADGKLGTPAEVRAQAERLLTDPRAKAKVREFLLTWLKVNRPPDLAKDAGRFPGFDEATAADLRTSLELFLDDVVWSKDADFRRLFLDDRVYLNDRLAKLYGAGAASADFAPAKLDPGKRAGVLTHPYLLSAYAYTAESSPIHRGVFVARGLLGRSLKPPQDAFTPLPPDLHPSLTTRERVALQTKPAACATCHATMNPLGFALEAFDAGGRVRDRDRGKPVDTAGVYETRDGKSVPFAGAVELARFLADSPEAHAAFAEQAFHHLAKQPVRAYGADKLDELVKGFAAGRYNIRNLLADIAVTAALEQKPISPQRTQGPRRELTQSPAR